MNNNPMTLSEQVDRLVAENQSLRVKSNNDDTMIHLLKEQYEILHRQVQGIRERADREVEKARAFARDSVMDMQMDRDRAIVAYREIEGLLLRATDTITQALRARVGDLTPEKMPEADLPHINDDRLPQISVQ